VPFLLRGLAAAGALAVSTATLTGLALPAARAQAATRCRGPEATITFADGSYTCQGPGVRDYPPAPGHAVTGVCAGDVPAVVTVLPPTDDPGSLLGPGECGAIRAGDPVIVAVP
jgi:hypothetical protein